MPQAWTLIRTQSASGWGIGRSTISNGQPGRAICAARIFGINNLRCSFEPAARFVLARFNSAHRAGLTLKSGFNLAHSRLMTTGKWGAQATRLSCSATPEPIPFNFQLSIFSSSALSPRISHFANAGFTKLGEQELRRRGQGLAFLRRGCFGMNLLSFFRANGEFALE